MSLWHQRNRWAEGGYQRYLDYWRPLVQNRLGPKKSFDLLVFCMTQYIIPTAAVPDMVLSLLRGRLPLLSPMTTLTVFLSLLGMVMGARRVRLQGRRVNVRRAADPTLSRRMSSAPVFEVEPMAQQSALGAIAQSIRGTLYMMHWFVVIVSMTFRLAIRPKRLKWVKTVHHGANLSTNPLTDTLEPEVSGDL